MKKTETISYLIDFINSGNEDLNALKKACNTNTNLKIYLCLDDEDFIHYAKLISKELHPKEVLDWLVKNQPSINLSVAVYDRVVEMVRNDMEQYFKYNGYKMANAFGTQEDWINHFYVKYYYFVNFYRDRWFFPENLTKPTKVKKTYKRYSDFLNLARKSITEERKVQARKAAKNPEASLNKQSIDSPVYQNNDRVTLLDVTKSEDCMQEDSEVKMIKYRIVQMSNNYENGKYTAKILQMLNTGDCKGRKTELVLLKIFAYKAGIVTPKALKFINKLSKNYKDKFGISTELLNKQMRAVGLKK